jgi:environmental stress-induced protein Ves
MGVTLLRRADYRRMRWKNGLGWTTEILRQPDDESFDLRLSVAEIESHAPFSPFAGIDRSLLLLEGNGMELRIADAPPQLMNTRGQIVRFAGETPVEARLLDGPTRDFNVMTRRERCTHQAWYRPLVGPVVLDTGPGVQWIAHLVAGRARRQHVDDAHPLEPGDTLLARHDPARPRVVLSGGGELVLVRIEAR